MCIYIYACVDLKNRDVRRLKVGVFLVIVFEEFILKAWKQFRTGVDTIIEKNDGHIE